jgi:hypothetical protein
MVVLSIGKISKLFFSSKCCILFQKRSYDSHAIHLWLGYHKKRQNINSDLTDGQLLLPHIIHAYVYVHIFTEHGSQRLKLKF